jgi:hypothetical protein
MSYQMWQPAVQPDTSLLQQILQHIAQNGSEHMTAEQCATVLCNPGSKLDSLLERIGLTAKIDAVIAMKEAVSTIDRDWYPTYCTMYAEFALAAQSKQDTITCIVAERHELLFSSLPVGDQLGDFFQEAKERVNKEEMRCEAIMRKIEERWGEGWDQKLALGKTLHRYSSRSLKTSVGHQGQYQLSLSRITLGALRKAIANDPNLKPEQLGNYVSEQIAIRLARVQGKGGNRRKEASASDIA